MRLNHTFRSILSIIAGFITVVVLSIGMDMIVEGVGILPPADRPELLVTWMLVFALAYRTVFTIIGGYVTAWLAPSKPIKHTIILGILGTIAGTAGVIGAWNLGNHWYPIALAVLALPSTWLGGILRGQGK